MAIKTSLSDWASRPMLNKVPEVILFFWVIKCLCTTIGETFSDNLTYDVGRRQQRQRPRP